MSPRTLLAALALVFHTLGCVQYTHGQAPSDSAAIANKPVTRTAQALDNAIKNKDASALQEAIDELVKNKEPSFLDLILKNISYSHKTPEGTIHKPFLKALYSVGAEAVPRVLQEIAQTTDDHIAADLVPFIVYIKGNGYSDFYKSKIEAGIDERTARRLIIYATID
jgi:hypothetical protein